MPRVWERRPTPALAVAGRGARPSRRADARVEARGFVDDLAAAYAGAARSLVPLLPRRRLAAEVRRGARLRAAGRRDAARRGRARGRRAGEHYLAAPDAAAFADALVARARRGGAPASARAGRALAERDYSIEALAGRLARMKPDERRSARLLFDDELVAGTVDEATT